MFSKINVKKWFIFIDTFIYLDRIFYKPKCTMSAAQSFVKHTGKIPTGQTLQLALQRRCSHLHCFYMKVMHIIAQCGTVKMTCTYGKNSVWFTAFQQHIMLFFCPQDWQSCPTTDILARSKCINVKMDAFKISNKQVYHSGCSCVLHNLYMLNQGYSKMDNRDVLLGHFLTYVN